MSKIGFPKKVLEKNKFAILIYKFSKGLKEFYEKLVLILILIGLIIGV